MDIWRWGVKMAKKAWTYLKPWNIAELSDDCSSTENKFAYKPRELANIEDHRWKVFWTFYIITEYSLIIFETMNLLTTLAGRLDLTGAVLGELR